MRPAIEVITNTIMLLSWSHSQYEDETSKDILEKESSIEELRANLDEGVKLYDQSIKMREYGIEVLRSKLNHLSKVCGDM